MGVGVGLPVASVPVEVGVTIELKQRKSRLLGYLIHWEYQFGDKEEKQGDDEKEPKLCCGRW